MGAKDSKLSCISYEEAIKRVTQSELRRIKEAFKKSSGSNGSSLSKVAFLQDVLSEGIPSVLADWLYVACGGTQKGIAFKELLCGLVLLTRGTPDEKIKFLWNVYCNDSNTHILKHEFTKALQIESTYQHQTPSSGLPSLSHTSILISLFGHSDRVTFEQFKSWILIHEKATVLSKWLLLESGVNLSSELETPTFFQSLAGVTHLEEQDIADLEKVFWSLKGSAKTGQLDLESLGPLITPPVPSAALSGVFLAFDENRDGHIDFKELCCGASAACRGPTVERSKFCFKVFDMDRDGVLNFNEINDMIDILIYVAKESSNSSTFKNITADSVLAELHKRVSKGSLAIDGVVEEVTVSDSSHTDAIPFSFSQEDFLMWSVQSALNLVQPFLDLLFEVCHIVLGLRPQCTHLEYDIVKGWLARESSRGYKIGQFWYLISSEWYQQWQHYTQNVSSTPCAFCKATYTNQRSIIGTDYGVVCDESFTSNSTESTGDLLATADSSSLGSGSSGISFGRSSSGRPNFIDNSHLIAPNQYKSVKTLTGEGGRLKRDMILAEHRDYELVPESLWKALSQWYRGPLPLPRQVIQPPNSPTVELELYPLNLRILRHQNPAPVAQTVSTWGAVAGGYGTMSSAGTYTSTSSAVPSSALTPPKRYLAYTAAFSRLATVKQVGDFLCQHLQLKTEDVRLWHCGIVAEIPCLLEEENLTLQELEINDNDQILLEIRNKDLTWPEELGSLSMSQPSGIGGLDRRATLASIQSVHAPGATGLHNLGNTCFMNSALQVLFNTQPLTQYFNQNMHLYELNTANKLGTKGQLAMRYSELLKEVWTASTRSVAPLKLRFCMTKYAPQFAGGGQHDSQELLEWLLDGLHEDLNRVTEKPYSELKDSDGRADSVVAHEAWAQHHARNQSIVIDLFYGQLKSKVSCLGCGRDSVRFDPFSLLSLPLPVENYTYCEVLVISLDGQVPVKYGLRLNSEAKYIDFKKELSKLCNLDAALMLVCELSSSQIRCILADDQKLKVSTATELFVYEIPKSDFFRQRNSTEIGISIENGLKDIQRNKALLMSSDQHQLTSTSLTSTISSDEAHGQDTPLTKPLPNNVNAIVNNPVTDSETSKLVMAASVYATPPPDFSGEDTALSDVSNSSHQSSSNSIHSKTATKRSLPQPNTQLITTPLLNTTICVSNGNSSSCGLSSPLDTLPDNSKKRRKQQTPIRISALNFGAGTVETPATTIDDDQHQHQQPQRQPILAGNDDPNLPKIFLSNLSQLQAKLSEIPDQDNNCSPASEHDENDKSSEIDERDEVENGEITSRIFRTNNLNCDQCNMKFDSEVKLGLHILQEHGPKSHQIKDSDDGGATTDRFKVNIKKEPMSVDPEWNNDEDKPQNTNGHSKPEDWLSIPGLPFSFPPEAAAMFSASGYLPQLPLLGVSSTSQYPSADGIHRPSVPPLRIFNPEAYCDLCNKEFCNKYFLKTHKANKHSIYDPIVSSTDMPSTSQLTHMSQVFQLQQQQLQSQAQSQSTNQPSQSPQQQQQQSQISQGSSSSVSSFSQEPSVFCDICFKRFTNIFAMRRHRSKVHEIPPPNEQKLEGKSSAGASNTCTPYTLPDGFREDFSIEQEDATFTPQPRKLSPSSSQQARESNFSADKLKRLGVINPEAFCELCCKEYCNKYFLRTHKIKRHGIYMPADDKDEKPAAWQFVQTSPLNLMMGTVEQMNRFQNQRKCLEAGEIHRKPSFDSLDEFDGKKSKLDDNKKAIDGEVTTKDGNKSSEETPSNQDSDAISVDLQKLQSMILQLNDLNAQRPVGCGLCGKEMENQYALHAHMLTEHAHIGENNNGTKRSSPSSSPVNCRIELCKQCDKEFPNSFALTQHLYEVHGIQQNSPVREGFVTPDRPISEIGLLNVTGQLGDRKAYSITPTSSYCEICNKELCNKYFMKTHMHRMHGIEIENGAQIGGVVCNICNKELCSKYFLRVHKHNTHGIVDEGSPLPQPRQNGDGIRSEAIFPMEVNLKPGEISELSNRYFTHFTEVCPLCNRRFRGSKWLRTHLMSDHGNAGTEKLREIEHTMDLPKSTSPTLKIPNGAFGLNPNESNFMHKNSLTNLFAGEEPVSSTSKTKEYQCTFCSFSTPSYAFLFIHERSHTLLSGQASHHNQSESAVSIAKDQQRIMQPASYGVTNSNSSETPTSTPATTPVPVPITPQESALTKQQIQQHLQQQEDESQQQQQQNHKQKEKESKADNQQSEQPLNGGGNLLTEAANVTQRPAAYALPQTTDGITMQSFLMEETTSSSSSSHEEGVRNRFVPSIVFLPVKERISGKMTVSFNLTPA